jgi:hypothetical protein
MSDFFLFFFEKSLKSLSVPEKGRIFAGGIVQHLTRHERDDEG